MPMKRFAEMRWPLLDQVMVSAANFLVGVVLVRLFGMEDYGVYVLLLAVVQFTQSFQNALLIAPMQTIGPILDTHKAGYFTTTARWFVLFAVACGFLVLGLAWIPTDWLPSFWRRDYVLALAAWVVASQLQDGMRRWQIAVGQERRAFLADVIAYPGQICVMILAGNYGLGLAQTILCFSVLLTISAFAAGLVHAIGASTCPESLSDVWRRNWSSSRWLAGTALLQWLSGNYVLMTVAVVLGPVVSGSIRAAQNLLAVTHVLFQGLENIVPVRAARHFAQTGWKGLVDYTNSVGLMLLVVTGGIALFALVFARPILELVYETAPKESLVAAAWYVPIYIVMAATFPSRTVLRVVNNTKPIFIAYILSAGTSIAVSRFALVNFGVHGAMAALLLVYMLILMPQRIAIRNKRLQLLRPLVSIYSK